MRKKQITIILVAAILVAAVGIGIGATLLGGEAAQALHVSPLRAAEKYLADREYAKSTATLEQLIHIEPNNTEAYLALSKAYQYMGDLDMAQETLVQGYEATQSTLIAREQERLSSVNTPAVVAVDSPQEVAFIEIAGKTYRADSTELVLRNCGLTLADLEKLVAFPNLERLDISDNGIDDISPLANLTSLQKLYGANNAITDVAPLAGLEHLTYVGLRGNQIVNADVLFSLPTLLYLHLSNNQMTSLPTVGSSLQLLYVADNQIYDTAVIDHAGLLYCDTRGNPGR